ncbi:hypothetical protein MSPP1_003507 [Malassezia sp. CBS 17886]|nr:hypothetical protein MSPP1_003507 [Malassezia sp. CBS 17886]
MLRVRAFGILRAAVVPASAPVAQRVPAARPISTTECVGAKQAAPKKKVSQRRGGLTGMRKTGGRRKGGVDTASSLTKSTGHYASRPDMSFLAVLDATAITTEAIGAPVAWAPKALEAMAAFGLPRELLRTQSLQPRPRSLVREASVAVVDVLERGQKAKEGVQRHLLVGDPGCGKSTYLLQAMAHALESGWAVLYIPRAVDLVNSSSPYSYNAALGTYLQPEVASGLLASLQETNAKVLARVPCATAVEVEGRELFSAGMPLDRIVRTTLAEHPSPVARQQVLDAVLHTLAQQTEVPFLVAIDDAQALFSTTAYRDADFAQLQSFELAAVRSLLGLLVAPETGEGVQRGAVLMTTSSTHSEYPVPPELLAALREMCGETGASAAWVDVLATFSSPTSPTRVQEPHAYTPMHPQQVTNARAAHLVPLPVGQRLGVDEAASLLDLLHRERAIWTSAWWMRASSDNAAPNDEIFTAKLVESDGNMRVFERSWRSSLQ